MTTVSIDRDGPIWTVTLNRPEVRNAVDGPTARALAEAFRRFDADADACVAVLHGAGEHFCAGADLRAVAAQQSDPQRANPLEDDLDRDAPMGPTRLALSKPVIAAVEGHAVAGGLELVLWCDLRVAASTAVFGVFCRRFGVPLIDGGTVRLPRLVGMGHAMDLILTGRKVEAAEALQMGLANRVVAKGAARDAAIELAQQLTKFPQKTMLADRMNAYEQWDKPLAQALHMEWERSKHCIADGIEGAGRFSGGEGRHGKF